MKKVDRVEGTTMGCIASRPSATARELDEKRALLGAWASASARAVTDTSERLAALRKLMKEEDLDAYIVPTEDAHGSEYTAACDRRREYITGFTGSAGTAVVLHGSAHLFTDGRYHIQAGQQLDTNWTLHKVGQAHVADWPEWLTDALGDRTRVGIDATLLAYSAAQPLAASLAKRGIQLRYPKANLVDAVWTDRPAPLLTQVYEHKLEYAGVPAAEKIQQLREWLAAQGKNRAYVLSSLDEIAWLLNVRGASIPCNPVFPAYVIVTEKHTTLYADPRLLHKAKAYLEAIPVALAPYDGVWDALAALRAHDMDLYFHERASAALIDAVGPAHATILPPDSVVAMAKACKNETEQQGLRDAYMRDGAAWVRWAAWLDEKMRRNEPVDERQAADAFTAIRAEDPLYAGMQAYDPISAAGPNAALPHYETPEENAPMLDKDAPYLNDSGAQYHDGTIDTTRTVHFGTPTAEQRRAYTRVLQGHLALASARFPAGTTGAQLDILARQPLFQDGYNFLHGTGHGIGSFLNVHEGPYGFSSSSGGSKTPVALAEGMAISDEPGYYEEGSFGIRIESILLVRQMGTHRGFGGEWLGFELITRVPISTKLVDFAMLSPYEKRWLQTHNDLVKRDLFPLVQDDKRAVRWLKAQ